MGDLVIRSQKLGKQYRIGALQKGYRTLRESIVDAASAPWRLLRRSIRGESAPEDELIWALRDIDFEVRQGEVLGVIGRNGAGKSTLLKVLARITEPTVGRVQVAGRVGSLLEVGTGFHPELTGRENTYLNGAILGMRHAEIDQRFDEIVAFSEIEKFIDTPVKHYSSGMFLRLAFAVAAHLTPEILLVDEVLAVGDERFQKKCMGKMESVGKEGRTILFVSHNMNAIHRLCPRVILLEEGRVAADGDTSEVIAQYLNADRSEMDCKEWSTPEQAPGDSTARLKRVRLLDNRGRPRSAFEIREPVQIEVEYWALDSKQPFMPILLIHNENGVCILETAANHDPAYAGKSRKRGIYRSVCRVPGNFFNEGMFHVDVLVRVLVPRRYFVRESNLLSFRIQDSGSGLSVKGDFPKAWSGVVAPILPWQTEIRPLGSTAAASLPKARK
ncbi:MAG: ABC transporter ATP-binding protein [Anaerolineales bacterium]|nr:ABC transporter ATP-binding protein [Anaerolineales bacterium]